MGYGIAPTSCLSFPEKEMEVIIMDWEIPSFVEVKMDSEINSYQDDFKDLEAEEQPPEAVISTDHT
jgi:hypothetical protein